MSQANRRRRWLRFLLGALADGLMSVGATMGSSICIEAFMYRRLFPGPQAVPAESGPGDGHPERIIAFGPCTAEERRLWESLTDVHVPGWPPARSRGAVGSEEGAS
jgi:hypothetical protein